MKSIIKMSLVFLILSLVVGLAIGQQNKPWTKWSKKDAEKILNDSGWGQTQTETNTSEMTWNPMADRDIGGMGQLNQATGVNMFIRFLSAKPIRQALARLAELDSSNSTPAQIDAARDFIDAGFDQTVVMAVTYEGKDQRFTGPIFQAFSSAVTSSLKNNTYLELKGGKRIFLQEYQPPGQDGLGAKFIFPRIVDDKPLIDPKSGEIRFYAEFPRLTGNNPPVTINMRFKVSKMVYNGVMEY